MEKLVFATNNKHKLSEVSAILKGRYEILSLEALGCFDEIPETAETLEGNAYLKASWVKEKYGLDCFADDTGLEVEALNKAPGVYSARYAGEHATYEDNNRKLMHALEGKTNRSAKFRTVICLILNQQTLYFEGEVNGEISTQEMGIAGFGYDPIFIPEGYTQSYAEMGTELKNSISHRAKATSKLIDFLSNHK